MDEMDEAYDEYLDGEKCGHNNQPSGHRKRKVSTVFFCSLFKFFFSPSSDILPFLLLI